MRATLFGLVVLVLVLASAAGTGAAPVANDAPLAAGHAEVIAHGVVLLPKIPVIWRVSTHPAQLPANAPVSGRVLGFVLADRGAFLVTDADSGDQTRLAPGEAMFVREGARQTRASLGAAPATYAALDLVPATDKNLIGTGALVFASDAFTAPRGTRDLDLVRDVLQPSEATKLPDTGTPAVILVTSGMLTVQAGGKASTLTQGQAAAFTGALSVAGSGLGSAAFAAAVIGPEVPSAGATATATAPAATGTLTITTRQCPATGVTPNSGLDTLNPQCPIVSSGIDFKITFAQGTPYQPHGTLEQPLTIADATKNGDGSYTWTNLPFAPYRVEQTLAPGGTMPLLISPNLAVPGPFTVFVSPAGDPNAPSGVPDQQLNLYDFPTASVGNGQPGVITVHVYACPQGQNPGNVDPSTCTDPAPAGYDFQLAGGNGGPRTVADAPGGFQGDGFTWTNLAVGAYHLTQTAYAPAGFDAYWVKPGDGISGSPDQGYDLTVGAGSPSLQVYVYEFQSATPPASGVIRVTTHLCPPGMDLTTLDRSACTVTQDGIDYSLTGDQLPRPYTLADALDAGDGAFAWQQLPFGGYHIAQTQFPAGYPTYWIQTSAEVGGGPAVGYDVGIAQESPARDLQVYDFQPAAKTAGAAASAGLDDLLIVTRDADSNQVGGACYELTNAGGTIDVCDNGANDALTKNGDPRILLTGIPAGRFTVHQTQVPDGYAAAADHDVTVIANRAFPNGEAIVTMTVNATGP